MALKDEDTLMKRKRELEEAIHNLGISFEEEEKAEQDDLANQFSFDDEALAEMNHNKDENK